MNKAKYEVEFIRIEENNKEDLTKFCDKFQFGETYDHHITVRLLDKVGNVGDYIIRTKSNDVKIIWEQDFSDNFTII